MNYITSAQEPKTFITTEYLNRIFRMPHSTATEASSQEDSTLPDAPTHALIEDEDNGSCNDPMDGDSRMSDAVAVEKGNNEVKLEDLFNTDDEDEWGLAQSGSNVGKMEGNSPPASPLYLKSTHEWLWTLAHYDKGSWRPRQSSQIPKSCWHSISGCSHSAISSSG